MPPPVRPQSTFHHPLTGVLAGEGSVRLVRELVGQGAPLSPRALADRTGLTIQGTRRALKRLVALGVVDAIGTSDRSLFEISRGHPLAAPLAALFAAEGARTARVAAALRAAIARSPVPVVAAWMYGSVARGEDTPASDVDVAVVFDVDEHAGSGARRRRGGSAGPSVEDAVSGLRDALAPLEAQERVTLSLVGVSLADVARLTAGDPWWAAVERDAVALVGLAPAAVAARARAGCGQSLRNAPRHRPALAGGRAGAVPRRVTVAARRRARKR